MRRFPKILLQRSDATIAEQHRKEFWREVIFISMRRVRVLVWVAITAHLLQIYTVNVRNSLHVSPTENQFIFAMHLGLFFSKAILLFLIYSRPLRSADDVQPYHSRVLWLTAFVVIVGTQLSSYVILFTKGHPIFYFIIVMIWYSALLVPPRILFTLLTLMVSSFWVLVAVFLRTANTTSYNSEAFAASAAVTVFLMISGSMLFSNFAETFRQRKALEEERNTIATLNAEALRLNTELEDQALTIKSINSQLAEQNQTLRELDAEKNELMGIVAHDLKNPISSVRGLADLMQSELVPAQDIRYVSNQIVTTADRMLELVTNLLDVNRLEAGKMKFQRVELDVSTLVAGEVLHFRSQAEAKQITIQYKNEAFSTRIYTDELAIKEVFDNLISNAIKYSPQGKNVFVRVYHSPRAAIGESSLVIGHSSLDIGQSSDDSSAHSTDQSTNDQLTNDQLTNDYVRVEVRDEGPGLSDDDKARLFGKFVRLSARPTGGEHSTGLGLSIVKKMVEAMQGRVWCESELGKGSTFIVELPLRRPLEVR